MKRFAHARTRDRIALAAALAGATFAAGAQQPPAPPAVGAVKGDAALGARLATQGAGAAAACAGCHGANGEGNAAAGFPRIAGQSSSYLLRQLQAYASGARQNPVMAPIAKAMNDEQQRAAAVHYAGLSPTRPAAAAAAAAGAASAAGNRARGLQLASVGDNGLRVQACANCHGPGGIGQPPAYPFLAGQVAGYLQTALGEWKSGARNTDPSGQMPVIAQRLRDDDVRAVAAYYASLPAPPARDRDVAAAWQPPRAVTVVSGPRAATGGTQGTGVDQGAATTGGGQGPGGGGGGSGAGSQGSRSGDTPPSR